MKIDYSKKTIYVAMPSYNEPYLEFTIKQIFEKAEFPERIYVGVWSHNSDGKDAHFLKNYKNVNYAQLNYPTVFGTGSGRLNALNFYNNEDYYFQIDPHMIFKQNWDSILLNEFIKIKEKYDKPVISTFVPYWYVSNGEIKFGGGEECGPIYWYTDETKVPCPTFGGGEVNWEEGQTYQEHYLTSGHFMFSEKSFIKEILPDVDICFEGEEPCLSVRAWTRGYRFFCIKEIVVWHFDRFHKDSDPIYEFDRVNGVQKWVPKWISDHENYRYEESLKKVKNILTGKIIGYWGAPTTELLLEYQKKAQVNFNEFYEKKEKHLTNSNL